MRMKPKEGEVGRKYSLATPPSPIFQGGGPRSVMEMAEARSGVQNSTKKSFCDGNNVDVGLLPVPWKGENNHNKKRTLEVFHSQTVFLCDSWQIWRRRKLDSFLSFGRDGILYFFLKKKRPMMLFFNMIEWWFGSILYASM